MNQTASLEPTLLTSTENSLSEVEASLYKRQCFSEEAISHFEKIAKNYTRWHKRMDSYIQNVTEYLQVSIPQNKKVLLIGAPSAKVLSALKPSHGVGLVLSSTWVDILSSQNFDSKIKYVCSQPEVFETEEKFDYVIVLNLADHSQDIMLLVESLGRFCHQESRVVLSVMNPLWHNFVRAASFFKLRVPDYQRNFIASKVLDTALETKNFQVSSENPRILIPKRIKGISWFFNRYLAKLPGFSSLCFMKFVFAKPVMRKEHLPASCSVIIPCFNEEGNIEECVRRVPQMGSRTEIVIVNDGSSDRTLEIARSLEKTNPSVKVVTYEVNQGKGAAVIQGIRQASCDIAMILDADMTVPPEDLPEFFEAIDQGGIDFVNGTRFFYPMEKQAMRLANFMGNILFSKLVRIIVGNECSDTLCGTKAFWRKDFLNLELEDNGWGDFDLIFHAAKYKLRSVQIPVHYKSRLSGESKMKAFKAGWVFLKMCLNRWALLP